MNVVGDRIRELRKGIGLSGNQLAKKSGIGQSTISDIENGKISPSVDTLERVCSSLGVGLSDFFAEELTEMPNDLSQLLKAANELTFDQRQLLTKFIESISNKQMALQEIREEETNHKKQVDLIAAHMEEEYGVHIPGMAEGVYQLIEASIRRRLQAEQEGKWNRKRSE